MTTNNDLMLMLLAQRILSFTSSKDTSYGEEGYWGHDTFMPREEVERPILEILQDLVKNERERLLSELRKKIDSRITFLKTREDMREGTIWSQAVSELESFRDQYLRSSEVKSQAKASM